MKRFAVLLSLLAALPAFAQNTVTLGASATSGNGSITTDVTWSTSPALTTGTPCTASGHSSWTGPKAGSGTQTITISTSGTLQLQLVCTFPGDSIVTFQWTNPTQNTDGSAYTNAKAIRIKYTFNPTLSAAFNPVAGETAVDVPSTNAVPATMRTVTGITQTGTLRASAYAVNAVDMFSAPSAVVTKVFTGTVPVTQSVSITVNPVPGPPTNLTAQ